jgi:hypothetical protein
VIERKVYRCPYDIDAQRERPLELKSFRSFGRRLVG